MNKKYISIILICLFIFNSFVNVFARQEIYRTGVEIDISAIDTMSGLDKMMLSNYSDFRDGDWVEYKARTQWELMGDKGVSSVYIKVMDKYGNTSDPSKASIDLGNKSPLKEVKLVMEGNKANITLPKDPTFTEMRFSEDGENWTAWEKFSTKKLFQLTGSDKDIYVAVKTSKGLIYIKGFVNPKPYEIIKVIAPDGSVLSGQNISKTVDYSITQQLIDVTVSPKATWKLYSDMECKNEIKDKMMSLKVGDNKAYIKVTSQDRKAFKIYTATVKRNDKNVSDLVKPNAIIIATKNDFADAFAGEVLAKRLGGRIILTDKDKKGVQQTVEYIVKNLYKKDNIYIFGREIAVNVELEKALKNKGYKNLVRIGGADKYETAKKIAEALKPEKGTTVVLVNGNKIPADGANIKKLCADKGYPILFVQKDSLTGYTKEALKAISPKKIIIVGNTAELTKNIDKELVNLLKISGKSIQRITKASELK